MQLSGDVSLGRYRDTTTEDYDDWQLAASGWLDATSNSRLSGVLTTSNLHETRVSADDANGLNPTKFDVDNAIIYFNHREGRFVFTPRIDYKELDYHDVKAVVLGRRVKLDQDYRDRDEYSLELKAAYEIGHKHDLFVRAGVNEKDYHNPQFLTGFDRSSDGYDAGVGFNFDFGGISHGKAYLGYQKQQYEDPLPDIDTSVYDILFNWEVTTLTSLQFGAERTVEETTALFESGYVSSLLKIRIDHELRRNLYLHAAYSRIDDDYESIESNTLEEQTDITSIGVKYIPNRNLLMSFRLENIKRDSTNDILPPGFDDGDFETEIYWFRVEIRQ